MIIQQSRYEMHLDIGPVVSGMPADDKPACFCNVGTAWPLAPKQVSQAYDDVIQLIIGTSMVAAYQRADIEVVLQVFAHTGEIMTHIKVYRSKMFRRAYA